MTEKIGSQGKTFAIERQGLPPKNTETFFSIKLFLQLKSNKPDKHLYPPPTHRPP